MEDKDIIKNLFEAIEKSEIPEKDELRAEANSLIGCFITYFIHVAREQLFYMATADKQNTAMMKIKNKMRGEAHDSCIMACKRLNEISEKVNTVPFAGFDTDDRRKVAEFAGYIVSSMYFSNINCKASLASCLISGDLTEKDVDIFLKVFRDELQERLNCLFEDIRVICHDAKINGRILSLDFEDSIGRHGTKETEIDPTRLYEPGYINSCIDAFFSNIGSALYAKKSSFVTVKISNKTEYKECIRIDGIEIPTKEDAEILGCSLESLYKHGEHRCRIFPILNFSVLKEDIDIKEGSVLTFGHQERGMFEVFQKGKAVSTVIKHFDFGEKSFSEKELKRKLREWSEKHGIRYG